MPGNKKQETIKIIPKQLTSVCKIVSLNKSFNICQRTRSLLVY